ncbi:di-heme oxidoredictase family protein [uncultured Arcobacter sp.]|uniref:di-heme oxidoredictase family protein n=1 Tax=uncultured Arcobacter sp. TaxID=165434 RepID=UPI002601BB59|nr:di-heme oxidoredictase family protein [uncultured Arcobacter sp.]
MKQNFNFLILILFFAINLYSSQKMNNEEYDKFMLGRSFFTIPWVEAPSATTARDGLGPLFNANTCIGCHPNNARGTLYSKSNRASKSLIPKLSIDSNNTNLHQSILENQGLIPEPIYGEQIAISSINDVPYEAKVNIDFEKIKLYFDDEEHFIYKPKYTLTNLNYGSLHKTTNITYRLAPTLYGMGLIDEIDENSILENVDENDSNNDGISGKANFVYSKITQKKELGRYTYKASVAFLKEQVANAAFNDMGLSTSLNQGENCTEFQIECNEAPKARDEIDITDERLDAITYYLKNLPSYEPTKSKSFDKGIKIFSQTACTSCHVPSLKSKKGKNIYTFSDLLLHDMGKGLSDGRVEFQAQRNEFRTAPLWGFKTEKKEYRLLHDGRAKTFEEAILWHGGEANRAKENYIALNKKDKKLLIEFLKGL